MSYYVVVASCEDSIPRERLQPLHERVSLLARKQGGVPFDCFDFTKRETPPRVGERARAPRQPDCALALVSPLLWLSTAFNDDGADSSQNKFGTYGT